MSGQQLKDAPGAIVFPQMFGPAVRAYGAALLWHGRLTISAGSHISSLPVVHFAEVGKASNNTPVAEVFGTVMQHFTLASSQSMDELKNLNDLGEYIRPAAFVGSGTTASYAEWEPFHETCLQPAADMLFDTQIMNMAADAFVWRVYERSLEMGSGLGGPRDPKAVAAYFVERMNEVGGPNGLLAECVLNRFAIARPQVVPVATNSAKTLEILAKVGRGFDPADRTSGIQEEQLAFTLFETVLRDVVPLLEPPHTAKVANLLENRAAEIDAARAKCRAEAARLIVEAPSAEQLEKAIKESIQRLHEEAQAIATVDRTAMKELLRKLLEDEKVWISLAGIVGSLVGSMPAVVPAAAAVTAFSLLGTSALRATREMKKTLSESTWSIAYHLART